MKNLHMLMLALAFSGAMGAQKKYEKMMYKDVEVEHESITITAKDIVATKDFIKFQLKLNNKNDQVILYKPEESMLKPEGGKELTPAEKWIIAMPTESGSRVINFKGNEFQVPKYTFQVNGLYRVSTTEKVIEVPDFMLPASTNGFKAGNFDCTMLNLNKETDKTTVKFECRYTGDKIGIINSGRAAVKLPDGSEIANEKDKSRIEVLNKGDVERFTLRWDRMAGGKATDMQKINMQIVWRNTFVEAEPVKIPSTKLQFSFDEAASK